MRLGSCRRWMLVLLACVFAPAVRGQQSPAPAPAPAQAPAQATPVPDSWPQFRGTNSSGRAERPSGVPAEIGPEKNVVWKVALPPGHSSPIVFDNRIFVTAVRNLTPVDDKSASETVVRRLVTICLDRSTGSILWERTAPHDTLEEIHQIGSHAQSSCATDGERVVSFFGSSGLFCYDINGEELWHRRMGPFNNTFGAGSSPIIVGDRVLLVQDHDTDSFLLAANKSTGETIWQADRSEFPRSYSSPVILTVDGRRQIVIAGTLRVVGYDFESGREVWTVRGLSRSVCMTPVVGEDGTLFVAGWSRGGDPGARITVEPFETVIAARDKNANGLIEDAELEKGGDIQQRFEQVDRDKSGTITRDEYEYYRMLFDTARNAVLAIRPGGTGDVTTQNVIWESDKFVPFCSSPLACNGLVFTIKDGGIATSYDAKSGALLKTKRIAGNGNYYASPVAADGRVYLFDQRGKLSVIEAVGDWKDLWTAEFGEDVYATPAIIGDRIYVRTVGNLYCFGIVP